MIETGTFEYRQSQFNNPKKYWYIKLSFPVIEFKRKKNIFTRAWTEADRIKPSDFIMMRSFVNGDTGQSVDFSYQKKELEAQGKVFISSEERKQEAMHRQKRHDEYLDSKRKERSEKAAAYLLSGRGRELLQR